MVIHERMIAYVTACSEKGYCELRLCFRLWLQIFPFF